MSKILPDLMTFDDCLVESATLPGRSVLLGNGFSLSSGLGQFSYRSLLEKADFGDRSEAIRKVFKSLDTVDFEQVGRALDTAFKVVPAYERKSIISNALQVDGATLRDGLVKIISDVHPENPSAIEDAQYAAARIFLRKFSKIFTLNYDLILYWARNRNDCDGLGCIGLDGFGSLTPKHLIWKHDCDTQNVFNLHGGLHLFEDGMRTKKIKYRSDQPMLPAIRDVISDNIYPLYVSESSSKKKRARIDRSPYLRHGFSQIKTAEGSVFIYGHSMDKSDEHIFDAIDESRVSHVYVSIHGDVESASNIETVKNSRRYFGRNIKLKFYKAISASIWR